jgi:hypothetical protein
MRFHILPRARTAESEPEAFLPDDQIGLIHHYVSHLLDVGNEYRRKPNPLPQPQVLGWFATVGQVVDDDLQDGAAHDRQLLVARPGGPPL